MLREEGGLKRRKLGRETGEASNIKGMVEETTKEEVETALVNAVRREEVMRVGDLRPNRDNTWAATLVVSSRTPEELEELAHL